MSPVETKIAQTRTRAGAAFTSAMMILSSTACLTAVQALGANTHLHRGSEVACRSLRAVDGDTIKCDGVNMRDMGDGSPYVSGYDTPELRKKASKTCPYEVKLARKAKDRMSQFLKMPGTKIYSSGQVDATRSHRPLVWVILPDGRSAGSVLISEGLARLWTPKYQANWCNLI